MPNMPGSPVTAWPTRPHSYVLHQDADPIPPQTECRALCVAMLAAAWRDVTQGTPKEAHAAYDWIASGAYLIGDVLNRYGVAVGPPRSVPDLLGMELASLVREFDAALRRRVATNWEKLATSLQRTYRR